MKNLLIAAAETSVREMLASQFERDGEYSVTHAADYETAAALYKGGRFDGVILDSGIVFDFGVNMCFPDSAVIVLVKYEERSRYAAADALIIKPFEPAKAAACAAAEIRQYESRRAESEEQRKSEADLGGLVVNFNSGGITLYGETLTLPPKEAELLLYLVKNRNTAFTREELLNDVWGYDYSGDTRTVDVHIKRLRGRLNGTGGKVGDNAPETVPENPKWGIGTVWGVGYKFFAEQ